MSTPILFLIFNRPDTTEKVFEAIRKAKPKHLFIAADGPRENKPGEKEKCEETRRITEKVDWPCEVERLYRKENLGCKLGVSSAITWFFDNVEEGIILEDDCLPDQSFFNFCSEMLKKYRYDTRVMHISGDNYQPEIRKEDDSYYFSNYPNIWGWATWKRCWTKYSVDIRGWNKSKKILNKFNIIERAYWANNFDLVAYNKLDTWDYQWIFNIFKNNGLAVISGVNLVNNIGFRNDATHTKSNPRLNFATESIKLPLKMKNIIAVDKVRDAYTSKNIFKVNIVLVLYQYYKKYILFGSKILKEKIYDIPFMINTLKVIVYHLFNKKLIFKGNETTSVILWNKKISIPVSHPLPLYSLIYHNYSTNLYRIAGYISKSYPSSIFIDVGANIGDSVVLIRKACENKIYCVEGNTEYLKLLRENSNKYKNISIVNKFLGEKDEEIFAVLNNNLGTGSINISGKDKKLKLKCLDSVFQNIQNIKLLKIDTDGFDSKIIRGGKKMIRSNKPLIFFEFDDNILKINNEKGIGLINFLIDNKYKYYIIYDNFGNYISSLTLGEYISSKKYLRLFDFNKYTYFDILSLHKDEKELFLEIDKNEKKFLRKQSKIIRKIYEN